MGGPLHQKVHYIAKHQYHDEFEYMGENALWLDPMEVQVDKNHMEEVNGIAPFTTIFQPLDGSMGCIVTDFSSHPYVTEVTESGNKCDFIGHREVEPENRACHRH